MIRNMTSCSLTVQPVWSIETLIAHWAILVFLFLSLYFCSWDIKLLYCVVLLATSSDKYRIPRKDKQSWTVYQVLSSRVFPVFSTAHVRTFLPNILRVCLQTCHPWIYVIFFWTAAFTTSSGKKKNHRNSRPFILQDSLFILKSLNS